MMDFDSPPIHNFDSPAFREHTFPNTHALLQSKLVALKEIVGLKDKAQLQGFVTTTTDEIDRTVMDATEKDDIYSTPDTAIMHALGIPIWRKPPETARLETEAVNALTDHLISGQMDMGRFSKGAYFLQVLLHKYKNGNGRVARSMKLLFDKSGDDGAITEEDTKRALGIGREAISQTGQNTFKINFNPDFERLVLGVAYFGLHKGLTPEQVTEELKLNGSMPEEGLQELATKLGTSKDRMKEEFIQFMVVDSDLGWCDFEQPTT